MDINYLIMEYSEIDKIVWSDILQSSPETLRRSNDGLLVVIKWVGATPAFVSTLNYKSPIYNKEEVLEIFKTPEWVEPIPTSGITW